MSDYRPIADYALIGDCHGAALVSTDGGIDWATLRRFDADPVLCRLLDSGKGGHWSIRPRAAYSVTRAYVPDTNILRTEFVTATGRVALTDCMPVGRTLDARTHDYVTLNAPGWIMRRLDGLEGSVELEIVYRPSVAFASVANTLVVIDGRVESSAPGPALHSELSFTLDGDTASAVLTLAAGEQSDHVLAATRIEGESPLARVSDFIDTTEAFWVEWLGYCRYDGPHVATMHRSALVLKALTYAPTGAIVAAPTTSLPREIGGVRNWDHRYCWVRDASCALYALAVLGYSGEVQQFHRFLSDSATASLPDVQPMYGIDGALRLEERELPHLEGYGGSAPVRVGNDAWTQRQIDNFAHILDLALIYTTLEGELDEQYRRLLEAVAAFVEAHWEDPDESLWELREAPRQHVHAKLMSWVAMDRAARLLDEARWRPVADRIRRSVDTHAMSSHGFEQSYEGGTDAATLLVSMLGYKAAKGMLEATIDTVKSELGRGNDLLMRYARDAHPDGDSDGDSGVFLLCTSWLADAELAVGRVEEGRARIERLIERANDVGLYAEEVDPDSGAFLGNFPRAFTHLGLIANLVNLELIEKHGVEGLSGGYAERAERTVSATYGWRGLLAATVQTRRVGRVKSSDRSKLVWP